MEGLIEGRIVHFVMPSGEHRPAIVVRVWRDLSGAPEGYSNLLVFVDGTNDVKPSLLASPFPEPTTTLWETSKHYSDSKEPGTWHWIEKV
jgi:hypothetical protein